ncbi:ChaN family lipoprotein [Janthinobacterium fluminis]|uniref:ChaN family lipoprotein n=1 Tax=Janthinobacterium fluminis TaxID=2987524 RepID=A0ABT5K239_9BURK|nr:ChaN family lipoprotein [Janthinobacterium fluminis]MDC8758796.1 ChaN family lipoprotein [Janthinobacterium fluminis]
MTSPTERRGRVPARLLLLAATLALGACAGKARLAQPEAAAPLANPQVLLLGEVHDNAAGHRARFADLQRRVEAGWRPAIAMEQFDRENQALLSKAQRDCADAECLIRVMAAPRWDWQLYRPVIALALQHQLPLLAANLSRADASRTVRDGVAATFDAAAVADYGLAAPLPADIRAGQQRDIVAGHCNMLPDGMIGGMVDAQIARDIWMAKIIRAQAPRDVVLLAGNGHVRKDIGVARWLTRATPALVVRSEGYVEPGGAAAGAFDVAHTVAAQARPDPCASLQKK